MYHTERLSCIIIGLVVNATSEETNSVSAEIPILMTKYKFKYQLSTCNIVFM